MDVPDWVDLNVWMPVGENFYRRGNSSSKPNRPYHGCAYRIMTCSRCGHDFLGTRHNRQGYCSPRCSADHAEDSPNWVGDAVTYAGAHNRVRAAKGLASDHACVDCGQQAEDWSYDGLDPDELVGPNGRHENAAYSAKPEHYVPRCFRCHRSFDQPGFARGERHGNATLTNAQVAEMRRLYEIGLGPDHPKHTAHCVRSHDHWPSTRLSAEFGVEQASAHRIVTGRSRPRRRKVVRRRRTTTRRSQANPR